MMETAELIRLFPLGVSVDWTIWIHLHPPELVIKAPPPAWSPLSVPAEAGRKRLARVRTVYTDAVEGFLEIKYT